MLYRITLGVNRKRAATVAAAARTWRRRARSYTNTAAAAVKAMDKRIIAAPASPVIRSRPAVAKVHKGQPRL